MPYEGRCLCGGCKVFLDDEPRGLGICHCNDCSRNSGSPFICAVFVPSEKVRIDGPFKIYSYPNSSSGNMVNRWFCTECGSHLASQSSARTEYISPRTGIFEEFKKLPISLEIFTKDRWPSIQPIEGALQSEDGNVPLKIKQHMLTVSEPAETRDSKY
ncbi:hypothetical protein APHAL10511_006649 [Amanita phalloides]|nr:hypothetical protein APHAL10511_006649 [Amanita phalloides]